MHIFKMLLVFAPWLAFLIIGQGSIFRLKIALVVGLLLSIVWGVARIHRGIILLVGLVFFALATVSVVAFENMWTIRFLGVLANGALALGTWIGVCLGKPFTLDYAREHADPSLWRAPEFIRSNTIVTSVWGAAFTANTVLAWGKTRHALVSDLAYEVLSYALLLGALAFTSWYTKRVRARRAATAAR